MLVQQETDQDSRRFQRGYVRSVVKVDWSRQEEEEDDWQSVNVTCSASNMVAGQKIVDTRMFNLERLRDVGGAQSEVPNRFDITNLVFCWKQVAKMTSRPTGRTGPAIAAATRATYAADSLATRRPSGTTLAATTKRADGSTSNWSTDCGRKLCAPCASRANQPPRYN